MGYSDLEVEEEWDQDKLVSGWQERCGKRGETVEDADGASF